MGRNLSLNSLPTTIKELELSSGLCLCLYFNTKHKGFNIEVRDVDGGELLIQPVIFKAAVLNESPFDIVDETCAKMIRRVREHRQGKNPFLGGGIN